MMRRPRFPPGGGIALAAFVLVLLALAIAAYVGYDKWTPTP
jgi:hypothetical protein